MGGILFHLFSLVSFFAYTGPDWSEYGAIDKPDRFEQVFDQYDIVEDSKKVFTQDFSMIDRQKMFILGILKVLQAISLTIILAKGNLR